MGRGQREETQHFIAEKQKAEASWYTDINKAMHGLTSAAQAEQAQHMQQLTSEQDTVTARVARQTVGSKEREKEVGISKLKREQ